MARAGLGWGGSPLDPAVTVSHRPALLAAARACHLSLVTDALLHAARCTQHAALLLAPGRPRSACRHAPPLRPGHLPSHAVKSTTAVHPVPDHGAAGSRVGRTRGSHLGERRVGLATAQGASVVVVIHSTLHIHAQRRRAAATPGPALRPRASAGGSGARPQHRPRDLTRHSAQHSPFAFIVVSILLFAPTAPLQKLLDPAGALSSSFFAAPLPSTSTRRRSAMGRSMLSLIFVVKSDECHVPKRVVKGSFLLLSFPLSFLPLRSKIADFKLTAFMEVWALDVTARGGGGVGGLWPLGTLVCLFR
jgi:hypothetical protein